MIFHTERYYFAGEEYVDIGPVQFLIHQGDITQEQTEAIVNSTNEQLDMLGGNNNEHF